MIFLNYSTILKLMIESSEIKAYVFLLFAMLIMTIAKELVVLVRDFLNFKRNNVHNKLDKIIKLLQGE